MNASNEMTLKPNTDKIIQKIKRKKNVQRNEIISKQSFSTTVYESHP